MKKNILVVDDFENTRFVVEFTLKNSGFDVLKAANGAEALKLFDGRKIDLLITDLNMPVMDGLALVKEVRKMENYKFLPILVLTTDTNTKKKELAKEMEVTGWIQKPFKMDSFLKIVHRCLK